MRLVFIYDFALITGQISPKQRFLVQRKNICNFQKSDHGSGFLINN